MKRNIIRLSHQRTLKNRSFPYLLHVREAEKRQIVKIVPGTLAVPAENTPTRTAKDKDLLWLQRRRDVPLPAEFKLWPKRDGLVKIGSDNVRGLYFYYSVLASAVSRTLSPMYLLPRDLNRPAWDGIKESGGRECRPQRLHQEHHRSEHHACRYFNESA